MLTKEYLRSIFIYKNGFLYWNIKPCYTVEKGSLAGCVCIKRGQKRRVIKIKSKPYYSSRLIFLYHNGFLPEEVDHEDRDTLNDKIENLREADHFKNMWNLPSRKNSSSKYLGVSYHSYNLWCARIRIEGKQKYLGLFKFETDAAIAYNAAAFKYRGEFANLNKIEIKKKTMINISIEGESAFDVRQQIQELLGLIPSQEISKNEEKPIKDEKIAGNFEASKIEAVKDEKPAEEITTGKKRRGKIESEKTALSVVPSDDPSDDAPEGGDIQIQEDQIQGGTKIVNENEVKAQTAVTAQMLQEKAVAEIRKGKKEDVVKIIKEFGGDSISQADKNPLKPEVYADVMDAFNKL